MLHRQPWQSHPVTQMLAVGVVFVPLYVLALWSHLSEASITLRQLFVYPLLLGGGNVVLALLIYRYICGERIASLNLKPGKWFTDVLAGLLLAVLFLGLLAVQQVIQTSWLPRTAGPLPEELITLFNGIVNHPLLLAVWLGPVVWLGVAGFEEVTRVFVLNRLWSIWRHPVARWMVLILSACLFGLVHLYQGPVSVVAIALQGLLIWLVLHALWSCLADDYRPCPV